MQAQGPLYLRNHTEIIHVTEGGSASTCTGTLTTVQLRSGITDELPSYSGMDFTTDRPLSAVKEFVLLRGSGCRGS